MGDLETRFGEALLAMDRVAARRIVLEAARSASPADVLTELVVPALELMGEGWDEGSISLAQVYMGGRICEEAVEAILPAPAAGAVPGPRCAIVVLDDYHLLGRRIVLSGLRSAGHHCLDYARMTVAEVVERVELDAIEILFVSVLMLPSALRVRELVTLLRQRNLPARVVVGGAPFRLDERLFREVGADAMGRTSADAVRILRELSRP